jgi:hypothetical protein
MRKLEWQKEFDILKSDLIISFSIISWHFLKKSKLPYYLFYINNSLKRSIFIILNKLITLKNYCYFYFDR